MTTLDEKLNAILRNQKILSKNQHLIYERLEILMQTKQDLLNAQNTTAEIATGLEGSANGAASRVAASPGPDDMTDAVANETALQNRIKAVIQTLDGIEPAAASTPPA